MSCVLQHHRFSQLSSVLPNPRGKFRASLDDDDDDDDDDEEEEEEEEDDDDRHDDVDDSL